MIIRVDGSGIKIEGRKVHKKKYGGLPLARHRSALRPRLDPSYPKRDERCTVHGNDMVPVIRSRPCICHQQFRPSPTKVDQC